MGYLPCLILVVLAVGASSEDAADTCSADEGPWGSLLQEWALSAPAQSERQGRIMALPPAQGYYVTDRVDRPPPPPRPHHAAGPPPHASLHHHGPPNHGPPHDGPHPYSEWQTPAPPPPLGDGKIVNRPPNPNKDQYRPNYIPAHRPPPSDPHRGPGPTDPHRGPGPTDPHRGPVPTDPHRGPGLTDRVDEPPAPRPVKQVSETDLYLLSAIEKLVYRVDLMEKRLRKVEENMHYLVAGAEHNPEPCVANFTRVGSVCYHVSEVSLDWKSANLQCRKLRSNLLELETEGEKRQIQAALLGDKRLRGVDVWTGGLNPGLLWIWSHSARPVVHNTTGAHNNTSSSTAVTIVGEGRCLAFVHDPARNTYIYIGQDCALRHRYICEKEEDKTKLSNEIERVARTLKRVQTLQTGKSSLVWRRNDGDKADT